MTNTNDFRRYSYANDPTYLINQFDFDRRSQTARKVNPEPERNFKVRENVKRKSRTQLEAEQKASAKKVLAFLGVAVFCLAMVAGVLYSFAVQNELTKQIEAQEIEIANAQSEHVSLQSQLDSLVSISMIDEYAVNKLGMTKVKSNQIQYMDVSEYVAKRQEVMSKNTPAQMAQALSLNPSNN